MKIFNTNKIELLKKALDVYQKEHEAISKNVANASNPDFKRLKTDFSSELETVKSGNLKTTNDKHLAVSQFDTNPMGGNENEDKQVDLAQEMAELGVNQIKYDFAARVLKKAYQSLDASIIGRMR